MGFWSLFQAKKIPGPPDAGPYEYVLGRRFDPGAEAEVFLQSYEYPLVLFRGAGRVAGRLLPLQPPAVYVNGGLTVAGLGSIQAGQFVGQPLLDPIQLSTEGG